MYQWSRDQLRRFYELFGATLQVHAASWPADTKRAVEERRDDLRLLYGDIPSVGWPHREEYW